jgi:hypothetical protein
VRVRRVERGLLTHDSKRRCASRAQAFPPPMRGVPDRACAAQCGRKSAVSETGRWGESTQAPHARGAGLSARSGFQSRSATSGLFFSHAQRPLASSRAPA